MSPCHVFASRSVWQLQTFEPMNERIRYLRERAVNATRMLRRGDFRAMLHATVMELQLFRGWWLRLKVQAQVEQGEVADSAYTDYRRLAPQGYRPTRSQSCPLPSLKADAVELRTELDRIQQSVSIPEQEGA